MFRSSLTLLALALAVSACDREADPAVQQEENSASAKQELSGTIDRSFEGTLLPAILLNDPDGNALNLGAVQGTPVLVNLWATWCAPCIVEMPMLDNLADVMGDDLRVVTISQDLQGADRVAPFFATREFRNLEPWLDPENAVGDAFGDGVMPITVLFDASGREIFRVAGGYEWDSEEAIAAVREAIQP
ncbi:MAG: TlpA disulfide reductase family protein [Erythrobacter sp.]